MKIENVLAPVKTYEQIKTLAKEAFHEMNLDAIQMEMQKMMIKAGSDSIPVQPAHIKFDQESSTDKTKNNNELIIDIDLKKLTALDWRGLTDNQIKIEIQALIIKRTVLETRSRVSAQKTNTRLENIIAEYVSRSILKTIVGENKVPGVFEWTDTKSLINFDYLTVALMRESIAKDSSLIKNGLINSFFAGEDFESLEYLNSLPEKTKLLFLELLKNEDDQNHEVQYVDAIFNTYNISAKEFYSIRDDSHFESKSRLSANEIKETILEVFHDLGWDELLTVFNEFRGRLSLPKLPYTYPDFVKFTYSEESHTMQVRSEHIYSFKDKSVEFSFDDENNLIIFVNLRVLYNGYSSHFDNRKLKKDLEDIFIHELNHFYSTKQTQVLHNEIDNPNRANIIQGTGVSESFYVYLVDKQTGEKKIREMHRGARMNEILTELGSQWMQNHYRPKADGSHAERERAYLTYVDAFGVLVLALHNYTGVGVREIIAGFFHNYYGENNVFSPEYLESIISEIHHEDPTIEKDRRDAVGLAFLELLKPDLKTIHEEYTTNLARQFGVNIELAKEIHQYI